MLDYQLVEAFAAVLDAGGFERAARRLCISQSAVSQRIRQLEESLGRILVIRETPPRATEAGERLLRLFRQVEGLEDEAVADLGLGERVGFRHLPIAVNADSLSVWLLDAIAPFLREARITIELFCDDQDRNLRFLQSGTAAGCVTSQRLSVQGFTSTRLGSVRYLLSASPDFAARWFPNGFDRDAASRAPVIHFNRDDQLQYRALERIFGAPRLSPPAHYIPSSEKFLESVVLGLGYGMIPEVQAAPELRKGRLLELDERGRIETELYWYRWSTSSRLLEEFTEILVGEGRRILGSVQGASPSVVS